METAGGHGFHDASLLAFGDVFRPKSLTEANAIRLKRARRREKAGPSTVALAHHLDRLTPQGDRLEKRLDPGTRFFLNACANWMRIGRLLA
jgi:hypothetical protein